MGADFLYVVIPKAKYTMEREKELFERFNNLSENELFDLGDFCGLSDVSGLGKAYWSLGSRRDVSDIFCNHRCYITGGMSWGDSPTEAFDVINALCYLNSVYELLKLWSLEDLEKEGL